MLNRKFAILSAGILISLLLTTSIADARPASNARERQVARGVEQVAHAYHQEAGEPLRLIGIACCCDGGNWRNARRSRFCHVSHARIQ